MVTKKEAESASFIHVKDARTGDIKRVSVPHNLQVGLPSSPRELALTGRFSLGSANYQVTPNDTLALKNDVSYVMIEPASTISGSLNVVLPADPRQGQLVIIKDAGGTAGTHNIVVRTKNGETIDSEGPQWITSPYGSVSLVWGGAEWTGAFGQSGGPTPSGGDGRVQFNSGGKLSADAYFTYDRTKKSLTTTNISGSLTRLSDGSPT